MKKMKSYKTFKKLFSVLWGNDKGMHFRLCVTAVLILVTSAANLLLPWILKYVVDVFANNNIPKLFVLTLVSYGLIWTLSQVTTELKQIFAYRPFERSIRNFNLDVFQKLLKLTIAYHIKHTTGGIRNAMERAEQAMLNILFGLLLVIVPMVIELLIAISILGYYYALTYAGILCVIFFLYSLFTALTIRWVVEAQRVSNKQSRQVGSYVSDVLSNIEAVYYQSGQKPAYMECTKKAIQRENAKVRQLEKMSVVGLGQSLIVGAGLIVMTSIVGLGVMKQTLVVGDFVLFNGYLLRFLVPLHMVGYIFREMREGITKMEDVMEILEVDPDIEDSKTAISIDKKTCDIEFKKVDFKYPNKKKYALKNISFSIPEGQSIAIIGENGSGKSTITKILYRFYDITNGQILFRGQDIRDIKLSSIRELIGIVPQDAFLLNDTIYKNLMFGYEKNIEQEFFSEIMSVTKIDELISMLPEKYDTQVGERGVKLSGGEKQRIGLARALLKQPKILILDEATSALDSHTEHQVYSYLHGLTNITKLIITHDWRNLSDLDKIIYLEQGCINAIGNHQELLTYCEKYNLSWTRQIKQKVDNG